MCGLCRKNDKKERKTAKMSIYMRMT